MAVSDSTRSSWCGSSLRISAPTGNGFRNAPVPAIPDPDFERGMVALRNSMEIGSGVREGEYVRSPQNDSARICRFRPNWSDCLDPEPIDKGSPNGISGLRAICVCLFAKKGVRRSRPLRGIGSDTFPGQFERLNSARSHGAQTRIGGRM